MCAVLAIWPALWSVSYAGDALRSGLPVLAPPLFAIGFIGVVLGAAALTVTGPLARPNGEVEPTPPLNPYRLLAGAVAGMLCMAAMVGATWGWIAVTSVDATTAQPVERPAEPADPEAENWAWKPPTGQRVLDVVDAGAGVVVRTEDRVVALDGRTGKERWHYRRPGAVTVDLAATPDGTRVMANFISSVTDAEGTRVLAFDAMTGEVGFDEVTEGGVFGGVRLDLTKHVLIGGDLDAGKFRGFDLRTGESRWEYPKPKRCRWSLNADAPVPTKDTVLLGLVCGPLRSPRPDVEVTVTLLALDDRTGRERWRFERTVPARASKHSDGDDQIWYAPAWTVEQYLQAGVDGEVVQFGWADDETGEGATYIFDAASGNVLSDQAARPGDEVIEFSREWMLMRLREPDDAPYRLVALDGRPLGSAQPSFASPWRTEVSDRALIAVETAYGNADGNTVELSRWDGGPARRVRIDLGRYDKTVGEVDLLIAPGAVVLWQHGTARIVGLA